MRPDANGNDPTEEENLSPDPISAGAALKAARTGAGWLNTFVRARKYIKRHDRLALRAYEDLLEWVKGERAAQQERLAQVDAEIEDDCYYSEKHVELQADARKLSAERWRAKKRDAERLVEDLGDRENSVHALVRRLSRRPWPPSNPYSSDTDALVANWECGVQPREVPPAPPAFQELAEASRRLGRLYEQAAALPDPGDTPSFCANRLWYHRVKPLVVELAGYEAQNPKLRTTRAYDIAYQTIYKALPDCRNCGELGMADLGELFPGEDWENSD